MCPSWAEYRHVLLEAIGVGDLLYLALIEAMVWGGAEAWKAFTSFCEAVTLAKEEAEREWKRRQPNGCPWHRNDLRPL